MVHSNSSLFLSIVLGLWRGDVGFSQSGYRLKARLSTGPRPIPEPSVSTTAGVPNVLLGHAEGVMGSPKAPSILTLALMEGRAGLFDFSLFVSKKDNCKNAHIITIPCLQSLLLCWKFAGDQQVKHDDTLCIALPFKI